MSKINIKMLSEDALIYIKENAESFSKKIDENENNLWIQKTIPHPVFSEKKLQIEYFDLLDNPESADIPARLETYAAAYFEKGNHEIALSWV